MKPAAENRHSWRKKTSLWKGTIVEMSVHPYGCTDQPIRLDV